MTLYAVLLHRHGWREHSRYSEVEDAQQMARWLMGSGWGRDEIRIQRERAE